MQSIVHIKRILSELANVQCSPSLHCQTQGRRLTFHGDIRPPSSPPFEFIPPSSPAPLHTVLKFREIEKGEKGRGRRNGEKKFEGWRSGVTRGDGNRNSVRGRRGRARETVLLLVFICGATEISALQLTRTISGERYFNGSQRLRAYTLHRPMRPNVLCHRIFTLVKRTPQVYFLYGPTLSLFFFLFFSFFPSPPPFSLVEIVTSLFFPLSFFFLSATPRPTSISISRTNNDEK